MPERRPKLPAITIPREVAGLLEVFRGKGKEAYVVGGCLRDAMLGREPKDWDIATSATPEEILAMFPGPQAGTLSDSRRASYEATYENRFGTVGLKTNSEQQALKVVEATTFRTEG